MDVSHQGERIPFSTTVTILVTGFPAFLHGPKLGDGESRLQFLVRHYPNEWNILIESIRRELGTSEVICSRLRLLQIHQIYDPRVLARVEDWFNYRLPSHWRTLESIRLLRVGHGVGHNKSSTSPVIQVLWPRHRDPSGDTSAEDRATASGTEVVSLETGPRIEFDISVFLPKIRGTYLWILPGGSRFNASIVDITISRILSQLDEEPRIALYWDGSYSFIFRVSSIASVAMKQGGLPSDLKNVARLCHKYGFSVVGRIDANSSLCEIEEIYGGSCLAALSYKKEFADLEVFQVWREAKAEPLE